MEILIVIGLILVVLSGILFLIYHFLSWVKVHPQDTPSNTPACFIAQYKGLEAFDTTPYFIPRYEEVRFSSRRPGIALSGWYAEVDPAAPVVILAHGLFGGKFAANILLPAGMLYRSGFSILVFDLCNHGGSTVDNRRTSGGNKEYLDVLGAWDYLIATRGVDPRRVGVMGFSLGGVSALHAFAAEPRIAAVFIDSAFANLRQRFTEDLARFGLPAWLVSVGIFAARLFDGVDLLAHDPKESVLRSAGRPIFFVHGLSDTVCDPHHTRDLAALAEQAGANVGVFYVPGAEHGHSSFTQPADYERQISAFFRSALEGDRFPSSTGLEEDAFSLNHQYMDQRFIDENLPQ